MCKYVIVDLEMCRVPKGLKREQFRLSREMIEIGAVLLDESYEIVDSFKSYVAPEYGELDSFIQKFTGITQANLKNAISAKEALDLFVNWLPEDAILVSWSDNDERQVRKEIELKNLEIPGIEKYLENWEDCQITFSEKMDSPKIYNLQEALNITGIDYNENIHNALTDAQNTALLFAKMQKEEKLNLISYYIVDDNSLNNGLLKNFSYAG